MATKEEITLAAKLVHYQIVTREEMQKCLAERDAREGRSEPADLGAVLLERNLVTSAELAAVRGIPLVDVQPLKDYRFERKIAEGGMAGVWLAVYLPIDEEVALKVMKPELARQERYRRRFLREAKLLMKLDHENIVKGYEIKREAGYVFCAMEHVDGATIEDRIEESGPFPERQALYVARETARALSYLDGRGVVHRDLKPGNILLTEDGDVKLIDLGLAKLRGGMAEDEAEGTTVGTAEYLSPEQARGLPDIDVRSDLYSLGATLFHMLAGEVPFSGENSAEVIAQQVLKGVPAERLRARNVSPYGQYLVRKLMAKAKADRYAHPDEVLAELEERVGDLSDAMPPPLVRPVPIARPGRPAARRRRRRRPPGRGRRR